ncbi:uncharacterized protein TNCV_806701 [Trichonephila clavipes]|nr:uncharacterized protein TNCV_806701 [Trichonephila clavipes]
MCKADVRKGLGDGLAMRLPLSETKEIYKDSLETDNRSNIGSEFNFEIDLPGKRDRSTIYRLNLIKLYRRKPELANLVWRIAQKEEIRKFSIRIKTCCSSQMLINTLREDTVYLLDLQEFEPGDASRDLSSAKKGKFCRKEQRGIVGQQIDFVLKWLSRVGSEVRPTKGEAYLKRIMSSFLVLREGDTRNRWRDEQVYPDVGQGIMAPWARRLGCVLKKKEKKRRERVKSCLGWRKGKSPALDGVSMRGEAWLKRTGRER